MSKMLKEMMKDPAMREMMRSQQKAAANMMYAAFIKDANLSPEEKDKFIELVSDKGGGGLEGVEALFGDDKEAKAKAMETMKEKSKKLDQDLRELLGEDRYASYTEYQGTIAERTQLHQFKQQLNDTELAVSDEQTKQLLLLMKEERTKVPRPNTTGGNESLENLDQLASTEKLQEHIEWQQSVNERVLQRSSEVLNEEQMKRFKDFQEQQLNIQKLGLKMAAQMFGTNATTK